MPKWPDKAVVFDLDDTIGHFEEIAVFIMGLNLVSAHPGTRDNHFRLFDLFPKFFRPGIFHALAIIRNAKRRDPGLRAVIYTNNIGPPSWTFLIKDYLEAKIGAPVFDSVITAYRPYTPGNCRSTSRKTLSDLRRCAGLAPATRILFFDDQWHPGMVGPNATYLKVTPFRCAIPYPVMVDTFLQSGLGDAGLRGQGGLRAAIGRWRVAMLNFLFKTLGGRYTHTKTTVDQVDLREGRGMCDTVSAFVSG